MSLILDALKRAERERQAPPSTALGDLPASRAPRRAPRVPWRTLVVVVVALGTFAAWKKFHKARPAPAPAVAQAPQPAPRPAPVKPTPSPDQSPIVASPPPPVIPGTEGMTSLEEIAQGEAEMAPPQPAPAPAPAPQPKAVAPQPKVAAPKPAPAKPAQPAPAPAKPEAAPAPAQAPIEQTPTPEEVPAPEPEPQAAPAEPPPREISPVLTQPAQYRKLKEMPPEYRADFPQLTIEVHVYQQIPQQRFVIINGRRYRQGDTLAEGPQLFEIAPDGIVVDYRNERLLIPIAR